MKSKSKTDEKYQRIHEFINNKFNRFIHYLAEQECTLMLFGPVIKKGKDISYLDKYIDAYKPLLDDFISGDMYAEITGNNNWYDIVQKKSPCLLIHVKMYLLYKMLKEENEGKEPDVNALTNSLYLIIRMLYQLRNKTGPINALPIITHVINSEKNELSNIYNVNDFLIYNNTFSDYKLAKAYLKDVIGDSIGHTDYFEFQMFEYFTKKLGYRKDETLFKIEHYHKIIDPEVGYLYFKYCKSIKDFTYCYEIYNHVKKVDKAEAINILNSKVLTDSLLKQTSLCNIKCILQDNIGQNIKALYLYVNILNKYKQNKNIFYMSVYSETINTHIASYFRADVAPEIANQLNDKFTKSTVFPYKVRVKALFNYDNLDYFDKITALCLVNS